MKRLLVPCLVALFCFAVPTAARAQLLDAKTVSLEAAKGMLSAAEAHARTNGWRVAIAVVDLSGGLIAFHRMDDVQHASIELALGKARTAARFRRPTKALAEAAASGRVGFLGVDGVVPLEGGVPITVGGEVIGAVGVSGMTGEQDAQVAQAGAAALQP
jgi:glc operon protein GlcG